MSVEEAEDQDDVAPENELDDVIDDPDEGLDAPADEGEGDEDQDDEAEGEEGENLAAGGGEGDKAKPSRRTLRVQKLEKERDERNAENVRLKQQLEQVLAGQKQPPQVDQAALQEEARRVAAMEPAERANYELQKQVAELRTQVQGQSFQQADGLDRARFEAKAELNPIYKKYSERVETALQNMRAKNANTTREALLTYMIGEDARKRLEQKSGGEQRRKAAGRRVEAARGKPVTARSDTSGSRSEKSLEDKLRGVQL